jgi:hypothetical protein
MELTDKANALKSLKIWFGSSTVVLTNAMAFGMAVGATALAVDVEDGRWIPTTKCWS